MHRSTPRMATRASAVLAAAAFLVSVGLASPASAADPSSTPENYTFTASRTLDEGDPVDVTDDVTTFTYTLVAAPDTDGGAGISHAVFAAFCETPIGYASEAFTVIDPSTGKAGVKTGELALGESLAFDFAGIHGVDDDGASIVIKQGNEQATVTVPGPDCPAPGLECGTGQVANDAGDGCVPVCGAGEELDDAGDDCQPVCSADEVLDDAGDGCVPVCGPGEELDDAGDDCQPVCGTDEVLSEVGDACVPVPDTCLADQVMVEGECTTPIVPVDIPVTCPGGSAMTDVDGDGELTLADCDQVLPDSGVKPTPATPAQPATPSEPATPATPALPAPSVLPETVVPTVVPAVSPVVSPAPAPTNAVLGAQVTRTAALPRTGSSTTGLAAFGVLLLGLGVSATIAGRRTART